MPDAGDAQQRPMEPLPLAELLAEVRAARELSARLRQESAALRRKLQLTADAYASAVAAKGRLIDRA